jgi:hypothetical protein
VASDADTPAVHPERASASEFFAKAEDNLADAGTVPLGTSDELGSLGWAQVNLLRAIYHELRYGNDLAAANSTASAKALDEHADAMDSLSRDMRGLGDSLNRHR